MYKIELSKSIVIKNVNLKMISHFDLAHFLNFKDQYFKVVDSRIHLICSNNVLVVSGENSDSKLSLGTLKNN